MFTRGLVTVVIVANSLLGHLCMMPMAYADAASMPMQHDESMEMNMTPMAPMSPAHCEYCDHVDQQNDTSAKGGCAEHCLAKAHDAVGTTLSVSSENQIAIALPPTFQLVFEPADSVEKPSTSAAPPINLALARGIVMIQ